MASAASSGIISAYHGGGIAHHLPLIIGMASVMSSNGAKLAYHQHLISYRIGSYQLGVCRRK